jgi:hypothetical protein
MNQKFTIDSIFKNQLQQMEQPGAEENWLRLEKELLAEQKRKRRAGAWLLGLLLLLGGSAALVWGLQGNEKQDGAMAEATNQPKPVAGTATTQLPEVATAQPISTTVTTPNAANLLPADVVANSNTGNGSRTSSQRKGRQSITILGGDLAFNNAPENTFLGFDKNGSQKINIGAPATTNEVDADASDKMMADNNTIATVPMPMEPVLAQAEESKKEPETLESKANHTEPLTDTPNEKEATAAIRKDKKTPLPSPQIELAAGVDVSNGYVGSGKYAMAMVRLALNKKSNLLVGAGYASNAMSESYKQADKPNLLNQEVDAKVRGLSMLQFPILYEQAIKENKLMFRAGITPVYIIDASIVNIPNGFGGNPTNFRTFTLKDINRLNVLFTAGLQLRLTQRLGIEFKAHYGLTELVKNSYINQSGENNNFKSTQVGLLFMIGKKR